MQLKLFFLIFSLFFKLLGAQPPQTAIILLQNSDEIRATGGFMGSYAKATLPPLSTPGVESSKSKDSSKVESVNITFQDIYVPDGQIQGHVEPPAPIQQAFGQGWYRLRDANWEPDFPTAAKAIRWFLKKGKETNPDILVAINLSTIQKILDLTTPIQVQPLHMPLTSSNISLLLQNNIQQNFFPGSTNKKDLLTGVGQTFLQKLSNLTPKQKYKIIRMIFQELNRGEILVHSKDPKLQAWLEKKDYAGQLKPASCKNCLPDTVAIIESNLGSNKANAHITRHTTHTILSTPGVESSITHKITIDYQNSSPSKNPDPPDHHGGDYINYIRLYIPQQATNIQVQGGSALAEDSSQSKTKDSSSDSSAAWVAALPGADSSKVRSAKTTTKPKTTNKFGFQEIGLFHLTPHQSTSSLAFSYQLPISNQKHYQLTLIKQPGIRSSPQTINLFGKIIKSNLTQDLTLKTKLQP